MLTSLYSRIRSLRRRPTAWTPARLVALVATIDVAVSRSRGLLWQDLAETVPAAADGDPVRVGTCPATGRKFTARSDAARPLLWDEGGGAWSLLFDGVDDGFAGPATALPGGALIAYRATETLPGATRVFQAGDSNSLVAARRSDTTVYVGGIVRSTPMATDGLPHTVGLYRQSGGGAWAARLDGADLTSDVSTAAWGAGVDVGFGGLFATEGYGGRMAGAVVAGDGVSPADLARAEAYLSALPIN